MPNRPCLSSSHNPSLPLSPPHKLSDTHAHARTHASTHTRTHTHTLTHSLTEDSDHLSGICCDIIRGWGHIQSDMTRVGVVSRMCGIDGQHTGCHGAKYNCISEDIGGQILQKGRGAHRPLPTKCHVKGDLHCPLHDLSRAG